MRIIVFIFFMSAVALYVSSCANQGSPTGGPRDTIPPLLVNAYPENKTTNYKKDEFTFTFDEYINADQVKTKLVITPRFENQFNYRIKKNTIVIIFEEAFEDSTTYTLNFADGITDITEKNPAINLSLAFSTGPSIDSMYIKGVVRNLYNNLPEKDILIALFDQEDTLDIFSGKPKYFTKTNESGHYTIENIKDGQYKVYAFYDDNGNLQNEAKEESHGFLSGYLDLTTPKDSLDILIQLIDSSPLKLIRSKITGRYFDVQYNKYIENYTITLLDSTQSQPIPSNNLIKDNETLRFYPTLPNFIDKDSLQIVLQVHDSLSNSITDTVNIKFKTSTRKPEPFSFTQTPKSRSKIFKDFKWTFKFNKPIIHTLYDSITVQYDTLLTETLSDSLFTWNDNNTELIIKYTPNDTYLPTKFDTLRKKFQIDSIAAVQNLPDSLQKEVFRKSPRPYKNFITLNLGQAAFISIDNDTTKSKSTNHAFPLESDFGVVAGVVTTEYPSFTLQLTDPEYNIIKQVRNVSQFRFNNIEPGKYTFRVLIDKDADGTWSPGNILADQMPEPIWFFDQSFELRANWQVENLEITF